MMWKQEHYMITNHVICWNDALSIVGNEIRVFFCLFLSRSPDVYTYSALYVYVSASSELCYCCCCFVYFSCIFFLNKEWMWKIGNNRKKRGSQEDGRGEDGAKQGDTKIAPETNNTKVRAKAKDLIREHTAHTHTTPQCIYNTGLHTHIGKCIKSNPNKILIKTINNFQHVKKIFALFVWRMENKMYLYTFSLGWIRAEPNQ